MPKPVVISIIAAVVVILLVTGILVRGCEHDASVEVTSEIGIVENGHAYDRAVLELGDAKKLVLPNDATVRRLDDAPNPRQVELLMRKTLAFDGSATTQMSIRHVRDRMGCAVKREDDTVMLATFGEWTLRAEGGAHLRLVALVPAGVELERRNGLSGPESAATDRGGLVLDADGEGPAEHVHAADGLAEGWRPLPDRPDPEWRVNEH